MSERERERDREKDNMYKRRKGEIDVGVQGNKVRRNKESNEVYLFLH